MKGVCMLPPQSNGNNKKLDYQFSTVLRDLINPEKYMPSHFVKQKARQAKQVLKEEQCKTKPPSAASSRSFNYQKPVLEEKKFETKAKANFELKPERRAEP